MTHFLPSVLITFVMTQFIAVLRCTVGGAVWLVVVFGTREVKPSHYISIVTNAGVGPKFSGGSWSKALLKSKVVN